MFFHGDQKCLGQVFLDNNTIRILSEFTITQKGIRPTLSEIVPLKGEGLSVKFTCRKCGKEVKNTDLIGYCFNCGNPFALNTLFKVTRHSGYYCEHCADNFIGPEYNKKPVSSLLKFYAITGDNNND